MQSYVKARIDGDLKAQVEIICKKMGISVSDYIRLSFSKLIQDNALTPNKETQEAILELRNGKGNKTSLDEIMDIFDRA
jgi:addiction module RelB/DinJ family antitoxin